MFLRRSNTAFFLFRFAIKALFWYDSFEKNALPFDFEIIEFCASKKAIIFNAF